MCDQRRFAGDETNPSRAGVAAPAVFGIARLLSLCDVAVDCIK